MSVVPFREPTAPQRLESALRALSELASDVAIQRDIRTKAWRAFSELHRCRDAVTVREMERAMGLGGEPPKSA